MELICVLSVCQCVQAQLYESHVLEKHVNWTISVNSFVGIGKDI